MAKHTFEVSEWFSSLSLLHAIIFLILAISVFVLVLYTFIEMGFSKPVDVFLVGFFAFFIIVAIILVIFRYMIHKEGKLPISIR